MARIDENLANSVEKLDWRDAPGITERGKMGTNSGLAERDDTMECHTGSAPLMVIEGNWVWWCFTHHRLLNRCELAKSENEIKRLKTEAVNVIRGAKNDR